MKPFRIPFRAMASACEIVLYAADPAQARSLAQIAVDEVQRIERKFSRYLPDSIVARINAAAGGDWTECDAETLSLLDFANSLFQNSAGLFDITSGVLRRAWDFKAAKLPDTGTLTDLSRLIGWQQLKRSGAEVRLASVGMEVDFGGFGKEYAADRAASLLAAAGVQHAYVNLAGDMRVIGPRPDGQPWLMGIQDPRHKNAIVATVPISGGALATSGDYERFFEKDGRRYCHILNPKSGMPVRYWRSVSVMAPLAIVAGGCATIAMLLQAQGRDFLAQCGYDFLAIDGDGEIFKQVDIDNAATR